MIPRYTGAEMGRIWSDQRKYEAWLQVEIAAVAAMGRAGIVPPDAARGTAFAQLQALAEHRAGRALLYRQLRPADRTPRETLQAAQHFLAGAQQRLRVIRRQADRRAERSTQWRKAR